MGKVKVRAMGRISIRITVGVIDDVCGVVPKKYWYRYWQYFSAAVLVLVSATHFAKVLVLVLAIL